MRFQDIEEEIKGMLEVADGELNDFQKQAMDDYLSELGEQEANKIDSFCRFLREETARALYLKEEAKRLTSKAKSTEERIGYLKNRYLGIMQEHGVSKIKGNAYQISIRHTPHVEVENVDALEDLYCRIIPAKREPDKKIIAEALKGGVVIPGCTLVQSDSLQIR